jgi:hypothetical protein
MATLLIGYEFNSAQGKACAEFLSAIKKLGNENCNCLGSTWIIRCSLTPEQARNALWKYMKVGDQLLVIQIEGMPAAWIGFDKATGDWLEDNL